MFDDIISALVAAFNEGANKGFWRYQWRDRYGKWMEMGRGALFKLRMPDGSIKTVWGVFIGGTENPGFGRLLVRGQGHRGIKDGVYEVASGNGEEFDALIPIEALEKQGIDPNKKDVFGQSVGERLDKDIQDYATIKRTDITPEDEKLATETPDENQKAIIADERAKSPVAKLAPGTESRATPEELAKLTGKEAAPTPTSEKPTFDPYTQMIVDKALSEAQDKSPARLNQNIKKFENMLSKPRSNRQALEYLVSEFKKLVEEKGGTVKPAEAAGKPKSYKKVGEKRAEDYQIGDSVAHFDYPGAPYDEGVVVGRTTDSLGQPKLKVEFGDGTWNTNPEDLQPLESAKFDSKNATPDSADAVAAKAVQDAMDGKPVSVDDVIAEAKAPGVLSPGKGPAKAPLSPDDNFDDIDFFDDGSDVNNPPTPEPTPEPEVTPVEEPTPTPTPEPEATPTPVEEPTPLVEEDNNSLGEDLTKVPDVETIPADEAKKPTVKEVKKALKVVAKMTPEELDALANPEDFIADMGGSVPSSEQTRAIAAIAIADVDTVIDALAGAGKTTVLVAAARAISRLRPNDGVLVLAFNAKNASDARGRMPRENTTAMTTHALARKILTTNQEIAAKAGRAGILVKKDDIATFLGADDTPGPEGENIDAEDAVYLVQRALTNFSNSADPELTMDHVKKAFRDRYFDGDSEKMDEAYQVPEKFLKWAQAYWANVTSDIKPGYWDKDRKKFVGDKRLRIEHDHYLKMWQLSNPDLSKMTINGKPLRVVLMDEAQDTNPTVAKVLRDNHGKLQITHVGDPNQNIYGFRGSENALENAKELAKAIVDLTVTFRFGNGMTKLGNAFLNLLGARTRVYGASDELGEIVDDPSELPYGPSRAHLVRTNYGGLDAILKYIEEEKTVGALSVFHNDLLSSYYYIKWVKEDFKTRAKVPTLPDGTPIKAADTDFAGITNFKQLLKAAEREPKGSAARWIRFLDDWEEKKTLGEFEDILSKIVVDTSDVATPDANLNAERGSGGRVWTDPKGEVLDYSVDDNGIISLTGKATFAYINGEQLKNLIGRQGIGFTWNKTHQAWEMPVLDDAERQKVLESIANLIPDRAKEAVKADVVISTAHRAKGLEWDHVSLGIDFPTIGINEKTGKLEIPSAEEFRLAYVAATRARKSLYAGGLSYGLEYEGRDGLGAANDLLERDKNHSADAWDYLDKVAAEADAAKQARNKEPISKKLSASRMDRDGEWDIVDDGSDIGVPASEEPTNVPAPKNTNFSQDKPFLESWAPIGTRGTQYSKSIDGFRWELTLNKDGSVTLRPRTNPELETRKYDSLAAAAKDFKNWSAEGDKSNRNALKDSLKPLDSDGSLAKLIDDGASAKEISDKLTSTDEWSDAIVNGTVNPVSIAAALNRVSAKTGKDVLTVKRVPKKIDPPTRDPIPPSAGVGFYDSPEFAKFKDDGSGVDRVSIPDGTLLAVSKFVEPRDVFLTLARLYNGKLKSDGTMVVHRKTYEEKEGPAAGQKRTVEISVASNQGAGYNVIIDVTNPETGDTQRFYHYNDHKSMKSLLGTEEGQSSGIQRLVAAYFDRQSNQFPEPLGGGKDKVAIERNRRYYGGVAGAVKYLRKANFNNILNDRGADDTKLQLRTPEEHAIITLNGRDKRLNASRKSWWTSFRKGRSSIFESIENGDVDTTRSILYGYLSNLPDTPEARSVAQKVITNMFKAKYPQVDANEFSDIVAQASAFVQQKMLPEIGTPTIAHRDRNGKLISRGDMVQWTNITTGEKVVGQVVHNIRRATADDPSYSYKDRVFVAFVGAPDGIDLSTKNLEVVPYDTPIGDYVPWLRTDSLKFDRVEQAGYSLDPLTGRVYDKHTGATIDNIELDKIDLTTLQKARQETGALTKKKASDLVAGDDVYAQNGDYVGKVKSARSGLDKNKQPVTAVIFEDDNRARYGSDELVDTATPEQKPTMGPVAQQAAQLGLGGDTPARTLTTHKADFNDPETTAPIKGASEMRAVKPTDDAREAKDVAMEIGAKLLDRVENYTNEALRDLGYDIAPGETFEQYGEKFKKIYDASVAKQREKQDAIDKTLSIGFKSFKRSAKAKAEAEADMKASGYISKSGKIDSKKLKKDLEAAGLRSVSDPIGTAANDDYMKYAFTLLQNSAAGDNIRQLQADRRDASKARGIAEEKHFTYQAQVGMAKRDARRRVYKEEGLQLDNISYEEMGNSIVSFEEQLPFRPEDTFISAVALQEAFDDMPASQIRQILKHLKDKNLKIFVRAGMKRGYFKPVPGGYEIALSSRGKANRYSDQNKATSTAGHELRHSLQKLSKNLRVLEHAYTYDRLAQNIGTDQEQLPPIMTIPGHQDEFSFAVPGNNNPYIFKQYNENNPSLFLNPEDSASEISSMLAEEMSSAHGSVSAPNKMTVTYKDDSGEKKKSIGYMGDKPGEYFFDKEHTKPIPNVIGASGRDSEAGYDRDHMKFALGADFLLNDWSPIDGFGPGNGVTPPPPGGAVAKPAGGTISIPEIPDVLRNLLDTRIAGGATPQMMSLKKAIDAGKPLSPSAFKLLLGILSNELSDTAAEGGKATASAGTRALRNYQNKLLQIGG